jgi:hypothetical protein
MNPPPVATPTRPEEPDVIELSSEEYGAAIETTLRSLGLTREQLRDQAERDDFQSPAAFMMWQTIRGRGQA